MNKSNTISGKSKTLKYYADVYDTIEAIKRIIGENYESASDLAVRLEGKSDKETFNNIWNFVRRNIQYKNDEVGKEQLRTPQRTRHDKLGDCDDFSILISSILRSLNINHELVVAAYKKKDQWQHIYPVAYCQNGNRYVIDCVPEIPYFNYEAKPIKNQIIINMKLEELGQGMDVDTEMLSELTQPFDIDNSEEISEDEKLFAIQGLLGNVALVDEDEEYDTVLSGSELKKNLILKQLIDAQGALKMELQNPTDLSELNDNETELKLITNIIENFDDDEDRADAISEAIEKGTMYKNFYKTVDYGVEDIVNGLSGSDDDDIYYLKVMTEAGLLEDDDDLEGVGEVGRMKFRRTKKKKGGLFNKIKNKVQKFKAKHPKLAKIGHNLKKFSPATFGVRRSIGAFMRANVFQMASKLAIGYASYAQVQKLGYTQAEHQKFVTAKNKAEQKWHATGGDKTFFKNLIMNGRGAKSAGLKGELGVAPAVMVAVSKVFGIVMDVFKKLEMKKANDAASLPKSGTMKTMSTTNTYSPMSVNKEFNFENENTASGDVDEKSGVITETITDENGKEKKVYKDKDGKDIGKFKALFLKNKTLIIIISVVLVVGIVGLIIWKARQKSLKGLGETGLSQRQENHIKKKGLTNSAYASLIREKIYKDKKEYNSPNRKKYYKKVFSEAYKKPLSSKQVSAAKSYNSMFRKAKELAKANGGGPTAWKNAWATVKKKV